MLLSLRGCRFFGNDSGSRDNRGLVCLGYSGGGNLILLILGLVIIL
jgi:hypothetical protein